jgi:phosphoribosylformylglycinamidine synthase
MTVGCNPSLGLESPFHAAMYAVIESVMRIVAMGGDYRKVRLSFQEYFEKLVNEESWGKPYAALMGAFLAQDELGIPAIGGKDSMSGTFKDINVPPSLISFAVAVEDTTKLISRAFKNAGNNVYLLKTPVDESGIPSFNTLKQNMSSVHTLVQYGCIKAASVIGIGGIAATVSEMAFGNGIGFTFDPGFTDDLFTPQYASIILEFDVVPKDFKGLRDQFVLLGVTSENRKIEIGDVTITLDEAQKEWEGALSSVFAIHETGKVHAHRNEDRGTIPTSHVVICKTDEPSPCPAKKPQVLIPIFPGSLSEYELEKQFRNAGAEVKTSLFRTKASIDIEDSYRELTEAIKNADILAIPSGMSAGAEPDGSSKLIAMILRHPDVKDAVNDLVNNRKGLILGIGEGFKALLKTGLIQTGSVQDNECGDVILAKNSTNMYHCTLKTIMIEENMKSPWLTGMSGEIETIPVSGQDSEIHLSEVKYNEFLSKGQIVSKYLEAYEHTPHSIEAMTSANGLILGRTGLVENLKTGLYANVFEAKESKIFTNAVRYIEWRVL